MVQKVSGKISITLILATMMIISGVALSVQSLVVKSDVEKINILGDSYVGIDPDDVDPDDDTQTNFPDEVIQKSVLNKHTGLWVEKIDTFVDWKYLERLCETKYKDSQKKRPSGDTRPKSP